MFNIQLDINFEIEDIVEYKLIYFHKFSHFLYELKHWLQTDRQTEDRNARERATSNKTRMANNRNYWRANGPPLSMLTRLISNLDL